MRVVITLEDILFIAFVIVLILFIITTSVNQWAKDKLKKWKNKNKER